MLVKTYQGYQEVSEINFVQVSEENASPTKYIIEGVTTSGKIVELLDTWFSYNEANFILDVIFKNQKHGVLDFTPFATYESSYFWTNIFFCFNLLEDGETLEFELKSNYLEGLVDELDEHIKKNWDYCFVITSDEEDEEGPLEYLKISPVTLSSIRNVTHEPSFKQLFRTPMRISLTGTDSYFEGTLEDYLLTSKNFKFMLDYFFSMQDLKVATDFSLYLCGIGDKEGERLVRTNKTN